MQEKNDEKRRRNEENSDTRRPYHQTNRERTRSPVRRSGYLGMNYDPSKDPRNRRPVNERQFDGNKSWGSQDNARSRERDNRKPLLRKTVNNQNENVDGGSENWNERTANQIQMNTTNLKSCTRKITNYQTHQEEQRPRSENQNTDIFKKCLEYCEENTKLRARAEKSEAIVKENERQKVKRNEKERANREMIDELQEKLRNTQGRQAPRNDFQDNERNAMKKTEGKLRGDLQKTDMKLQNQQNRNDELERRLTEENDQKREVQQKLDRLIDNCTCNGYLYA